jgi:hypothetical protein
MDEDNHIFKEDCYVGYPTKDMRDWMAYQIKRYGIVNTMDYVTNNIPTITEDNMIRYDETRNYIV